jgi:DNA-binding ferritin-like protein
MALLKDQENSNSKEAADFVLMLLHAVTNTHILHWQTRSFSNHMALGEFYDSLQDLVDTYVESYQGKYGIINNFMVDYAPPLEPVAELTMLKDQVKARRAKLPQDSELQNLIDEIASQIDQTLYKLRFLK